MPLCDLISVCWLLCFERAVPSPDSIGSAPQRPVVPAFESQYAEDPQTWNRCSYVYNRPLNLTDPDGRCPQCLPPLGVSVIGGTIRAGITLATGGNARDAAASFAGGFVAAGLPVLTLGTSLVPELTFAAVLQIGGVGAGSNLIGGVISRGLDSDDSTAPFDPAELTIDGLAGFASVTLETSPGFFAGKQQLLRVPVSGPS